MSEVTLQNPTGLHLTPGTSRYIQRTADPLLHVQEWAGAGPACLLIHGFGEGSFMWDAVAPQLAPELHCMAPDLRGHGDSGWASDGRYPLSGYLRDVDDVISANGSPRWVVIGHSLGGEIAIRFAAARPDLVSALVIVDFGPGAGGPTTAHIHDVHRKTVERRFASSAEYLQHLIASRPLSSPDLLAHIARRSLRPFDTGVLGLKCDPGLVSYLPPRRRAGEAGIWADLKRVEAPTLVLRAIGSGILSRADALRMIEVIPSARLETIPMSGHGVLSDNPDAVAAAVRSFVLAPNDP